MDENADKLGDLINFSKHRLVYKIIMDALHFQGDNYNLVVQEDIKNFVDALPSNSEQELYATSLKLEPRDAGRGDIR